MKKIQKGFTLVELIVVITILAILGTIAFISLQGYSQDAKNSKVTSDIRTIVSAIETTITEGDISLSGIVTGTTDAATASGNFVTNTEHFGSGVVVNGTTLTGTTLANGNYAVGEIDFVALRQNGTDFKDPNGKDYIAAYVADTAKDLVFYQVVGQTKDSAGNFKAVVKGNYVQIDPATDIAGLVSSVDEVGTGSGAGILQDDDLGTDGLYE